MSGQSTEKFTIPPKHGENFLNHIAIPEEIFKQFTAVYIMPQAMDSYQETMYNFFYLSEIHLKTQHSADLNVLQILDRCQLTSQSMLQRINAIVIKIGYQCSRV